MDPQPYTSSTNLKHTVAKDDLPRENLQKRGAASLSNADLIAILMGSGTQGRNVCDLSSDLLQSFGGIEGLSRAQYHDILAATNPQGQKLKGIGAVKATILAAAIELGRRFLAPTETERAQPLNSPERAITFVQKYMLCESTRRQQEGFWVLYLNTKCILIGEPEQLTLGLNSRTVIDPSTTFRRAVWLRAASIIVVHNHPSGDVTPSEADISTTRRLIDAGNVLGIKVVDHIIVGDRDSIPYSLNRNSCCDFR